MSTLNVVRPGIGNAASYQSSGKPWMETITLSSSGSVEINFPLVTKFVTVKNNSSHGTSHFLKIGLNQNGVSGSGTNYIKLLDGEICCMEIKVTSIYVETDGVHTGDFSVVAGLTNIDASELTHNWSGSAGVG